MPFKRYHRPSSIQEAVSLLGELAPKAAILAGGTDLLVDLKRKRFDKEQLIDVNEIRDLEGIRENDDRLIIGALTRIADLADSPVVNGLYPFVASAAGQIGSAQIRNRATLAGNICRASPAADMVPSLIALEAQVRACGPDGDRLVPLEGFFVGPGRTVLAPAELVTHVEVPKPRGDVRGIYLKHGLREAMEIAIVGVAVCGRFQGGHCQELRIVLGAVGPTAIAVRGLKQVVEGESMAEGLSRKIAEMAASQASPISDLRATAEYRLEITRVLVRRALQSIC